MRAFTYARAGTPAHLHPMQAAFIKHDGYQCGYCTPGQVCSAVAVLDELRQGIPSHASGDIARPRVFEGDHGSRFACWPIACWIAATMFG